MSLYFFWIDRKEIFSGSGYSLYVGIPVVIMGLVFYWVAVANAKDLSQNDFLSLSTLGFVACLNGGFIIFYGNKAFRKAIFPLLFLAFMIPIPTLILDPLIRILVAGSAETSYAVLKIFGVPVYLDGFVFELPGIAIEVAKECSGIRSTLALLITSVIAGYMFLESRPRRILLTLCICPITIFKNALRISTLALLASYVDPSWITNSWLHQMGGKPFFILALLFMLPVLWLLSRSEKRDTHRRGAEFAEKI